MKKTPPHLPPKTCNIKFHNTTRFLPWLMFFIFIAGLASVALTLTTLVWFAPTFIPDQLVTNIQKSYETKEIELDIEVINKLKQRTWFIYDKRQKIDDKFYLNSIKKMQAVMFSSDGWAVMYTDNYRRGDEDSWEGIDYQGTSYDIEKVFVDPVSKLTYVKFEGDGFPFVSFANWNNVSAGNVVWEFYSDNKKKHVLEEPINTNEAKSKTIWGQYFYYKLKDAENSGGIVVNEEGGLVGLVDENKNIIPGWMVDSQYASIIQDGVPEYKAVAWKGYMVHGYISDNDKGSKNRVSGFYVINSPTGVTSSTVGIGDLVTHIQNKSVIEEDLSRQLLFAPEKFSVTILREEEEVDIIVEKIKVGN